MSIFSFIMNKKNQTIALLKVLKFKWSKCFGPCQSVILYYWIIFFIIDALRSEQLLMLLPGKVESV